jgi:hypothetical protein
MSSHESLDQIFDSIVGQQGLNADIDEQAYVQMGERLLELGVLERPLSYYKFLGAEGLRLEVIVKRQAILHDKSTEPTSALRITCNRDREDEVTRDVVVDVDDYVIDLSSESLAHIHSAVVAKRQGKQLDWQWSSSMAPHFWETSGFLHVHNGEIYESQTLPSHELLTQDAATIYGMLEVLSPLTKDSREDIFGITVTPHVPK